jgi:hypothetical protein
MTRTGSPYLVYPVEADGDDVRAPVGGGVAGAVARGDAPAVERDGHIVRADAGRHAGAQVETWTQRSRLLSSRY